MTDMEIRVNNLETKFELFLREMSEFKTEMREFKAEMRDRDNRRATEIAEIRKKQDEIQAKHDSEMKEMNEKIDSKFDKLSSQIQNMAIAAVVGVGAIVWAVVSALR